MKSRMTVRSAGMILTLVVLGSALPSAEPANPSAEGIEFFEKKIRPLLADNCVKCHGAEKQKGGLRLDSLEMALKGGDNAGF